MTDAADPTAALARMQARLAELDAERGRLQAELETLPRAARTRRDPELAVAVPRSSNSPPPRTQAEKVALFGSLFRGRADVYPVRWENSRTGKTGYSPRRANEWRRGVCEKPKVKCGECPAQAFFR